MGLFSRRPPRSHPVSSDSGSPSVPQSQEQPRPPASSLRPRAKPDLEWRSPEQGLLALGDEDIARMSDEEQSAFEDAVRDEVAHSKAYVESLESDSSPYSTQQKTLGYRHQSALFKLIQSLNYDRARRAGEFDDMLGPHPKRW